MAQHTVFALDYDNTLFPTQWMKQFMETDMDEQESQLFERLEAAIYAFITVVSAFPDSTVCIVTSAKKSWILDVAREYMPSVFALLNEIEIVSAREDYENEWTVKEYGRNTPMIWKYFSFLDVCRAADAPEINFIQIGDSDSERMAAVRLRKAIEDNNANDCGESVAGLPARLLLKSVMFVENPSSEQLLAEVTALTDIIKDVVAYPGDIDDSIRAVVRQFNGRMPVWRRAVRQRK